MTLRPSELKMTRGRKVAQARVNSLQDKVLGAISLPMLQKVAFAGPQEEIRVTTKVRAREEIARRQDA
jgi:hypothetical protein